MKLSLIDVLTLAKQGYKKADIDELLKIDVPLSPQVEESTGEESDTLPVEDSAVVEEVEPVIEENKEVEELKKQIDELNKKLENAQSVNKNTDMSDKKTINNDGVLQSLVDSFM